MKVMSIVQHVNIVINREVYVEWNGTSGQWPLGWEGEINSGPTPIRLARAVSKAIVRSRREARAYKVIECFEGGEVRFYIEPWEFSAPTDGKTIVGVFS